ncbi:MAG: 3-methylornithyl-N6-L-lysine dehydrogenase PylD [Desulfotignum sp.]|nr:3-methylornithyl-N6-L-lysine dehydrogenase PylD [Desulfotignum sp.]
MTRLQPDDICHITPNLAGYSRELEKKTGRSLLGIACHACNLDEGQCKARMQDKQICVVPVTAGLGIISRFSDTVAAILTFLGCRAKVADQTDVSGVAQAFASGYDALMMADDHRFVAIDLHTRQVTDNADAAGRGFAAALDLMAGGIRDRDVLVLGCGPVGASGAAMLASLDARVALLDKDRRAAEWVKETVSGRYRTADIIIEEDLETALSYHRFVLEATPVPDTITGTLVSPEMRVAAPGVPSGVSAEAAAMLGPHLVHDTLEIGVAVMAVSLVYGPIRIKR